MGWRKSVSLAAMVALLVLLGVKPGWSQAPATGSAGALMTLGHLGGQTHGVRVADGRVYFGAGAELLVFDAAASGSTTPLARLTLPGLIEGLDVSGNLAVVAAGSAGVRLVSLADPMALVEVGAYAPAGMNALAVRLLPDARALVAAGAAGVLLLDVHEAAQPALLAQVDTPGSATDMDAGGGMAVVADGAAGGLRVLALGLDTLTAMGALDTSGEAEAVRLADGVALAYLADGTAGLRIANLATPAAPKLAGTVDTPGYAQDVAVRDEFIYLADGRSGVRVVLAADPAHPVEVHHLDVGGLAERLDTIGDTLAVGANGLRLYALNDESEPLVVGQITLPGFPQGVAERDGLAYVADERTGLEILDVHDPTAPRLVGSLDSLGYAMDVALDGAYAYIANGYDAYWVVDVSDPARPATAFKSPRFAVINDILVRDGVAYFNADEAEIEGLYAWDTHNPRAPAQLGWWNVQQEVKEFDVEGDHAYALTQQGIHGVDFSDPQHPAQDYFREWLFNAQGLTAQGEYLYFSSVSVWMAGMIQTMSLQNPAAPALVDFHVGPFGTGRLFTAGERLFLTYNERRPVDPGNLVIFSLADPAHPQMVGRLGFPIEITGMDAADGYAYVTYTQEKVLERGLKIVSISGKGRPAERARWVAPASADGLDRVGTVLYVADSSYGLDTVSVQQASQPTGMAAFGLSSGALKVLVEDGRAYAAAGADGLQVITMTSPYSATLAGVYDPVNAVGIDLMRDARAAGRLYFLTGVLEVVNAANPLAPARLGFYQQPNKPLSVDATGSDVYVGYANVTNPAFGRLVVVRANNPAAPGKIGQIDFAGPVRDLDEAGGRVYAAVDEAGSPGLRVIDISTPTAPKSVGSLTIGSARTVRLDDSRGRVYLGGASVWAVDVGSPTAPHLLASQTLPGNGVQEFLVLDDGTVVVAAGRAGLYVMRYLTEAPTVTPTHTVTTQPPTAAASATATASATDTPTSTSTAPATATPTITPSLTAPATETPTASDTATETTTPTILLTNTATPTPTSTETAFATPIMTPTSTASPSPRPRLWLPLLSGE